MRVTSAGFEELNRQGVQLINTTDGLNRNLEAGLELFRLYKQEFGDQRAYFNLPYFSDLQRFQDSVRKIPTSERVFLFAGVLGGFTTFSAFGVDTIYLLRRGETSVAFGYVAATLLCGFLALWLSMKVVPHQSGL